MYQVRDISFFIYLECDVWLRIQENYELGSRRIWRDLVFFLNKAKQKKLHID